MIDVWVLTHPSFTRFHILFEEPIDHVVEFHEPLIFAQVILGLAQNVVYFSIWAPDPYPSRFLERIQDLHIVQYGYQQSVRFSQKSNQEELPSIVVGSLGKALKPFRYSGLWLAGSVGVNIAWNGTTSLQGATLWLNFRSRRLTLRTLSSMRAMHNLSISSENFCPWFIMPRISDDGWFFSFLLTSCLRLARTDLMQISLSWPTVIFCRQFIPLDARSLEEDLTTARTVHSPCWGNELTALATILVNKSYTVVFGWHILATTWGRMVKSCF